MYSTCIFCHSGLGDNTMVEHFPVGRRLAFDAARGRLWVICERCERWNLSPLEERWEAIDECERLFSDARLRFSTDNIGLARLREGLELVRIGAPVRREMAAWRYGDQFGRRRARYLAYTGAGVATALGLFVLGPATGLLAGGSLGMWNIVSTAQAIYRARRVHARLVVADYNTPVAVRLKHLKGVSLVERDSGWALRVPFHPSPSQLLPLSNGRRLQAWTLDDDVEGIALLTGDAAIMTARKLLPAINARGATRAEIDSAVRMLGAAGEPRELFERHAARSKSMARRFALPRNASDGGASLSALPTEVRLALEMAAHETSERRALEGELGALHAEWRQAEEIAAISDDMFVPEGLRRRLASLKRFGD